jgi:hypothetical protein
MTVETARMLDFPCGCLTFKIEAVVLDALNLENRCENGAFSGLLWPFWG